MLGWFSLVGGILMFGQFKQKISVKNRKTLLLLLLHSDILHGKGVFRPLSKVYDGAFCAKLLLSAVIFFKGCSNLDVRMGPVNVFACDSHTNIYYLDGSWTPIENYDRVWQLRKVS